MGYWAPDTFLLDSYVNLAMLMLVKSVVVLLATWACAASLRRGSSALRHALWSFALLYVLLLPALSMVGPRWVLPVLPVDPGDVSTVVEPETADPTAVSQVIATAVMITKRANMIEKAIFAVWVLGSVFLILRLLFHVFTAWLLRRRSIRTDHPIIRELLAQACREQDIRRMPHVYLHRSAMPMTSGLLVPIIYLPVNALQWPLDRLHVVLLHEVAHIKRRDFLTHIISDLSRAIFWVNPLVWLAWSRMHAEQEQACDDRVLRTGTRSAEYADHLLAVARQFYGGRAPAPAATMLAGTILFKRRIRAILNKNKNRQPLGVFSALILWFLFTAATFPLTAVRIGPVDIGGEPELRLITAMPPARSTGRPDCIHLLSNTNSVSRILVQPEYQPFLEPINPGIEVVCRGGNVVPVRLIY